tara:strand:- start:71 stop:616 length:546 start_codon:yes stop_codon:yes gene_type:complete
MMRLFFLLCFKLFGWTTKGELPDLKKFVLIVAPHTSMMDYFVGVAARSIFRLKSNYLAKDSLFKVPIVGWFLRITGGYAVDRSKNTGMVDQVIELFNTKERFVLTITPEGTRKPVTKWKTGFYWIAVKSKIPIVMVGFDYEKKFVEMRPPFYPTGHIDADMETMLAYFRTIKGKHPEKGVV